MDGPSSAAEGKGRVRNRPGQKEPRGSSSQKMGRSRVETHTPKPKKGKKKNEQTPWGDIPRLYGSLV